MGNLRLLIFVFISLTISSCGQKSTVPQDGDIVFHKWTHCGIVFHIGDKAYVYEAVDPVRYTPLKDWVARGKDGVYCAKRLKSPLL